MFAKLLFIELSKIPNLTLAVILDFAGNDTVAGFAYCGTCFERCLQLYKTQYTLMLQSALFAIALSKAYLT